MRPLSTHTRRLKALSAWLTRTQTLRKQDTSPPGGGAPGEEVRTPPVTPALLRRLAGGSESGLRGRIDAPAGSLSPREVVKPRQVQPLGESHLPGRAASVFADDDVGFAGTRVVCVAGIWPVQ